MSKRDFLGFISMLICGLFLIVTVLFIDKGRVLALNIYSWIGAGLFGIIWVFASLGLWYLIIKNMKEQTSKEDKIK